MAITINTSTDIDVVSKQRKLVTEALGADGVYIKMKETVVSLLDAGEMTGPAKAKIISETMANMTASVIDNSMSVGLQWAAQEKDLELKKLELQYQLDVLDQQKLLTANQVADSLAGRQLKQAQRIREYGTSTRDSDGNVLTLGSDGKEYSAIQNVDQDTANKVKLNDQITAQTEEVQARTHRTVADTFVNHGMFTGYTISATGITGASKQSTGYVTLSELNKSVAAEQAKGYTYNAWSNAATSSSGMIGTLIAAEIPGLDPATYLAAWNTAVTKLNGLVAPTISI